MEESASRYLVLELVDEGRLTTDEALVLLLALAGREGETAGVACQPAQQQAQPGESHPWSGVVCI